MYDNDFELVVKKDKKGMFPLLTGFPMDWEEACEGLQEILEKFFKMGFEVESHFKNEKNGEETVVLAKGNVRKEVYLQLYCEYIDQYRPHMGDVL